MALVVAGQERAGLWPFAVIFVEEDDWCRREVVVLDGTTTNGPWLASEA